jgi:hypothetical protein
MATAVAKAPVARLRGTVRVSLPAKVAYNPDSLKKTIGELLEHLGCTRCFSGADCLFTAERDFVVDPAGKFTHQVRAVLDPSPEPWRVGTVAVSLPRASQYDIKKVFSAIDAVAANLGGCRPCHSGFDIDYLSEVEFIGINEKGEAQHFGGQQQFGV